MREAIDTIELDHKALEENIHSEGVKNVCQALLGGEAGNVAAAKGGHSIVA